MSAHVKSIPAAAIAACLILTGFSSCKSSGEAASGHPDDLVGIVRVIGNAPFTALALEAPDGTIHRLRGPGDVERRLYARQGKTFRVSVVQFVDSPLGPVAEISSATPVSP